jgi:lipopolysaccharide biosynthesis regulator YciM
MSFVQILVVIGVIALLAGLIVLWEVRKKQTRSRNPYTEALHHILEGRNDQALEYLKKTVKRDTENIMAYIQLGDIFREKGYPLRGAKIHRNLLVRGDIRDMEIDTVLYHLVLDYKSANMLDKAIEMAERLVQRNKKNVDYQSLLLSFYEEKGDWDKAYFYRQSINRWLKKQNQPVLALYKVKSGLQLIERGAEREGRIRFREAIKLDKKCIPAYLQWGESYTREGRNDDAVRVWREFTQKIPDHAHLVFDRLNDVLFDLGRYSEIEDIYQQIIRKKPKDPTVYINLAELYRKQGKMVEAMNLCNEILETHPEAVQSRLLLIQLLIQKGDTNEALEEAVKGLNQQISVQSSYTCSNCHYISGIPMWHCPQCREWNSFLHD